MTPTALLGGHSGCPIIDGTSKRPSDPATVRPTLQPSVRPCNRPSDPASVRPTLQASDFSVLTELCSADTIMLCYGLYFSIALYSSFSGHSTAAEQGVQRSFFCVDKAMLG